jgi:pimeloyl-ACP methyl ester carboxylesterase
MGLGVAIARWSFAVVTAACAAAPDPAVRERLVATASGALFVRTGGAGADVVLLHGLGDSSIGWYKVEQPLRELGFRVTVWDALGTGRSERPDPGEYGLAAHVERLREVMDRLGIARAHLVGNSLGGTEALLFAQFHPERVERLVLINPAAYPEGGTTPAWFWHVPGLAETLLAKLPPEWVARSMLWYLAGDPRRITEEDIRLYAAGASGAIAGLVLQERQLYPEPSVVDRWVEEHRRVAAPALILWGRRDRILPIEQAQRLQRDLPHAELQLLDGVGHIAQLEVPQLVVDECVRFLQRP